MINPKDNHLLGRVAEITKTKSGLILPNTEIKNVTVFAVVDAVGDGVTKYKPGDVVLPRHVNHIYLRGGFHRVLFKEEDVVASADVPLAALTVEGDEVPDRPPSIIASAQV